MKHTQEEYLAYCKLMEGEAVWYLTKDPQSKSANALKAFSLANRDVLVRHEGKPIGLKKIMGFTCMGCSSLSDEYDFGWPCPTRTDVTKWLDEVMG